MRNIREFDFKGKNVLVRCDFNVPISEHGKVLDDFRIKAAIPTINYLRQHGAKVILMSHLGSGDKLLSLKALIPKLETLLSNKIFFFENYLSDDAPEKIKEIDFNKIILLENLRFNKQEKQNDPEFAKKLSRIGDIYVNEAFSVCHRKHASVCSITKFIPSLAGLALEKEIKYLGTILKDPKRPFVVIMGGIKIETKIKIIVNVIDIVDHLLLGSKLGEIILAERGLLEGRVFPKIDLLDKIDLTNPKLHIPVDGNIGPKYFGSIDKKTVNTDKEQTRKGAIATMKKEEDVYDIGPETIKMFNSVLKEAKTILWNGPLGMYEDKNFKEGTKEIAEGIIKNRLALKIAGGGETIDAIAHLGLIDKFDFISTGGGAMLKFLAGEKLPGVECLKTS